MREKVCIVLNEREPAKAKAAQSLQDSLKAQGILASRIEIDAHIQELIVRRAPRVLVLDYLIGDYTTGLDILSTLNARAGSKEVPRVIFLTDEPSVPVAVAAMRLGAADYLELERPQSINNVCRMIAELLAETSPPPSQEGPAPMRFENLVGHSQAFNEMIAHARAALAGESPIIVLHGPHGAGRSSLVEAMYHAAEHAGVRKHLDLSTFDGALADMIGLAAGSSRLRLGRDLTLVVEDADTDSELLDLIAAERERIFGATRSPRSRLYVCASSTETARAWKKLTEAAVVPVPSLMQRREDIISLTQRFQTEAAQRFGAALKPFDAATAASIASLEWPGEIRQLRAAVYDATISGAFHTAPAAELIDNARSRWDAEESLCRVEALLDPAVAYRVLEQSEFRYRVAAARLGCSVRMLRTVLARRMENSEAA